MNFSSLNDNIKAEKRQASLRENVYNTHKQQFGSGVPYKSIVTIHKLGEKWGKGFSRHSIKEIIGSCETKIMSDSETLLLIVQIGIVFESSRISPEKQSNQNSTIQNT